MSMPVTNVAFVTLKPVSCRQAQEEKRVRNDRIKRDLRVRLAYPTYVEGLAALNAGDTRPFD